LKNTDPGLSPASRGKRKDGFASPSGYLGSNTKSSEMDFSSIAYDNLKPQSS
jgi:hypothetical protein